MNDEVLSKYDPIEIAEAIVGREIEKVTRAQLLDLIEASVPPDRLEATKRLADMLLKDLSRRVRAEAIAHSNGSKGRHYNGEHKSVRGGHKGNIHFITCACGYTEAHWSEGLTKISFEKHCVEANLERQPAVTE